MISESVLMYIALNVCLAQYMVYMNEFKAEVKGTNRLQSVPWNIQELLAY
jgi:hypothetical protein